jgi:Lon protease-like protein
MEIPLFPLHTVLCPGIALPLHIFEPRYRLMIERCVRLDQPFGIVLIREGREVGGDTVAIAGVGTLAEIRQVTKLPDGRYDLLVVGSQRFAIEEVDPEREPWIMATVTPLDDDLGDPDRATRLASRTMRRFVDYLHLLQPVDGETADELDVRVEIETEADPAAGLSEPDAGVSKRPAASERAGDDPERSAKLEEAARRLIIPEDPTVLSYLLSGILQVDAMQRQVLLEAETTEERIAVLDEMLDRELWMLRRRLRHYAPEATHAVVRRN